MATTVQPVEPARVTCEVCLKEVPQSEAVVSEAMDYVLYFCGADCFQRWRQQPVPAGQPAEPST